MMAASAAQAIARVLATVTNKLAFLSTVIPDPIPIATIHDPEYASMRIMAEDGGMHFLDMDSAAEFVDKSCMIHPPVRVEAAPPVTSNTSIAVNPVDLSVATVCTVPITYHMLAKSAFHMAFALGHSRAMCDIVASCRDRGYRACMSEVLDHMMKAGIPLLIATGRDNRGVVTEKFQNASTLFSKGSVLMLCDTACNVIAVAQPMGSLMYVEEGMDGVLPRELRPEIESKTCVEMLVRIVCVPPAMPWFKNDDADFRWDLLKKNCNATTYCPLNGFMVDMFKLFSLSRATHILGDYKLKLAALQAVPDCALPTQPKGRPPTQDTKMAVYSTKFAEYEQALADSPAMWTM